MVLKTEKHAPQACARNAWIIRKESIPHHAPNRRHHEGLAGLQSHVRYSVFKERDSIGPSRWEKADGESSLGLNGSQEIRPRIQEALLPCSDGNIGGPHEPVKPPAFSRNFLFSNGFGGSDRPALGGLDPDHLAPQAEHERAIHGVPVGPVGDLLAIRADGALVDRPPSGTAAGRKP